MRRLFTAPRVTAGVTLAALVGLAVAVSLRTAPPVQSAEKAVVLEHAMFGGSPSRNFVVPNEKFAPVQLMPVKDEAGKELKPADAAIKWQADLGSRAYGGPTIAGGKIFIGTNNEKPRNPRDAKKNADGDVEPIDLGILMCFEEATGKFLWQSVHDKLPGGPVVDWPKEGICSSPLVEGDRVYYVSNRCTLVCADVNGAANGRQGKPLQFLAAPDFKKQKPAYDSPTDADILWELDMIGTLGVFPHNMSASSPLLVGDILYIVTANGVDEGHINIPSPQAPSFIAVDKKTGKVLWTKNDPGKQIMHGQWSNPCYADIKGVRQVIFPGGDGILRGYKPETGDLLWQFDCNPRDTKYELGGTGTRNDFIGTPVIYNNLVYIGVGQDPEHFSGVGHFWCIDPSKATDAVKDITPKVDNFDPKDPQNAASGLVWHYGGNDKRKLVPRDFLFGRTMSSAAIIDDILYIGELQGYVQCLDAKTGKKFWQYDLKGAIWGSTIVVDGKVYVATESGDLFAFKHAKTPTVIDEIDIPDAADGKDFNTKLKAKRKLVEAEYLLGKCEFPAPIRSTPVVVNGVMYVMTESTLFALEAKK